MPRHTLVALYPTSAAAERAAADLVEAGIPRADIDLRSGAAGDGATAGSSSVPRAREEEGGFWGWLFGNDRPEREVAVYQDTMQQGGTVLAVQVDEDRAHAASEILDRHDPVDVDEHAGASTPASPATTTVAAEETRAAPVAGAAGFAAADSSATRAVEGDAPLQVAEEELRVGKRETAGGKVRVRSYVTERPVEEQVALQQERVTIERRPVDRELRAGDPAFEERSIEVVERGEEAVVSKTARVVEEISVGKDIETETETVRDTVRRQDVEVEDDRASAGVVGTARRDDAAVEAEDAIVPSRRSGAL